MSREMYDPTIHAAEPKSCANSRLPYSSLTAGLLLQFQERTIENRLSPDLLKYFELMRHIVPRVETELSPSHLQYDGSWLIQDGPTCVPFALANNMKKINKDLPDECFANMLNESIDLINGRGYDGSHPSVIQRILIDIKWMNVDAVASPNSIYTYKPDLLLDASTIAYHQKEYDLICYEGLPLADYNKLTETQKMLCQDIMERNQFRQTARKIKRTLNRGCGIMVGITDFKRYAGLDEEGGHEVGIVGYDVNDKGMMDVQVVDSNWGIFWVSLEHLSSSFSPKERFWEFFAVEPCDFD